jgi:exodeoxyribonuclease VII large subunit
MEPVGIGAAEIAKRQLMDKLRGLGWFDEGRKKPLPRFPKRVALLTSATGAAVRDMIQSFARRWPLTEIIVRHSRVQGETAAAELAAGLEVLNVLHVSGALLLDAIIIGRGGGSAEDLNAFNAETVAAAIYASQVVVVSAVGHEIDVTIADLVADARSETPSNAVTLLTPHRDELLAGLLSTRDRLNELLRGKVINARRRFDLMTARPAFQRPLDRIRRGEQKLDDFNERLKAIMQRRLQRGREKVTAFAERLESLSPLNVLKRGYSVTRSADGKVIRDASAVAVGDSILTTLASGELASTVSTKRI